MPSHRPAAVPAAAVLAAVAALAVAACQRVETLPVAQLNHAPVVGPAVTYRDVVPASALPHPRGGLWVGPHYASGQAQTVQRLCKPEQTHDLVLADRHCVSATIRRTATGGYRLAMACTVDGHGVVRDVHVEGDLTTHYSIDSSHGPDRGEADGGDYVWRGACPPGMPATD